MSLLFPENPRPTEQSLGHLGKIDVFGAETITFGEAQTELSRRSIVSLGLFLILVTASQFWFDFFRELAREIFGYRELPAWLILIIAVFFSVLVLVVYAYAQVPIILMT